MQNLENNSDEPLVTIGILTYNSAKYVLETLESVKAQTYKNIELVISDDASKDNSVELCRKWVTENKDRFIRCEILTVAENTGIPANVNRRLVASKGVWIKGIAADDLLAPDCVENFINFVNKNPQASVVFAKMQSFVGEFAPENFTVVDDAKAESFCKNFKTAKEQYNALVKRIYCAACTMFVKRSVLLEVGYDESLKTIEDWPIFIRLTGAGHKFYFMDKTVCYYRRWDGGISGSTSDLRKSVKYNLNLSDFRKKYIYPNAPFFWKIRVRMRVLVYQIFACLGFLKCDRNGNYYKFLAFLFVLTSPARTKKLVKNLFKK